MIQVIDLYFKKGGGWKYERNWVVGSQCNSIENRISLSFFAGPSYPPSSNIFPMYVLYMFDIYKCFNAPSLFFLISHISPKMQQKKCRVPFFSIPRAHCALSCPPKQNSFKSAHFTSLPEAPR